MYHARNIGAEFNSTRIWEGVSSWRFICEFGGLSPVYTPVRGTIAIGLKRNDWNCRRVLQHREIRHFHNVVHTVEKPTGSSLKFYQRQETRKSALNFTTHPDSWSALDSPCLRLTSAAVIHSVRVHYANAALNIATDCLSRRLPSRHYFIFTD